MHDADDADDDRASVLGVFRLRFGTVIFGANQHHLNGHLQGSNRQQCWPLPEIDCVWGCANNQVHDADNADNADGDRASVLGVFRLRFGTVIF